MYQNIILFSLFYLFILSGVLGFDLVKLVLYEKCRIV